LALERALRAQPSPQLEHEPLAVEIALPVEEVRLDPALGAAVMGIDADRDCRPAVADRARVDAVRRDEQLRIDAKVRRRKAERAPALVTADDGPVQLERTPEKLGRTANVALMRARADRRRGDAVDERHFARPA